MSAPDAERLHAMRRLGPSGCLEAPPPEYAGIDGTRREVLQAALAALAGRPVLTAATAFGVLASRPVAAQTPGFEARFLTSGNSDATREIVAALASMLPAARFDSDLKALIDRGGKAVYGAIGPSALNTLVNSDTAGPILSTFCSNETFTRVVGEAHTSRGQNTPTAIYAEASPQAQMQLVRAIYNRRVDLGVLLSDRTSHLQPALEAAARAYDLGLEVLLVDDGRAVARAIAKLDSADLILTVPDRTIYTPDSVRELLDSTYRRRQGVIGYSATLVRTGALAAAYPAVADIAAQLGAALEDLGQGRGFAPQYPKYWRVAVNNSVSRSLSIAIDLAARTLGNFPPKS